MLKILMITFKCSNTCRKIVFDSRLHFIAVFMCKIGIKTNMIVEQCRICTCFLDMTRVCAYWIKIKLRSFKSSEHINEKMDGPSAVSAT